MSTDATDTALSEALLTYFRYPERYFWRWSAEGVAEWQDGTTIAYAQELMSLMAELAPDGLPALGATMLVFAACADSWQYSRPKFLLLSELAQQLQSGQHLPVNHELLALIRATFRFLDTIRALPTELRTGQAKLHLLRELLSEQDSQPAPEARLAMPTEQFKELMAEIGEDQQNLELLTLPASPMTRLQMQADLLYFERALRRFPTTESLALRLRTGLTALPEPLPLDLPTPPAEAEPVPADLLAELAQDAPTTGLARLAQRLAALLHLPQHAEGAGSLPLGGVADVTNRGSFDRLLLRELAQDDLSLTARLVHGEALYLRREEPPAPQPPPRVVLVDTTIQLWGEPRVFALAAALAVAHPARPARQQPRVMAYALGGTQAQPLDLFTKAGVTEALGYLDPALHCGAALHTLLREPSAAPTDYLLITEAEAATHPDFVRYLAEATPVLRFLLTVARSGEVAFYEFRQGRRTLLTTLHVDLEDFLYNSLPPAVAPTTSPDLPPSKLVAPAFLRQEVCPLLLPTVDFRLTASPTGYQQFLHQPRIGLLGLTTTRRLLHWSAPRVGARELLHLPLGGQCCVGFDGKNIVSVLLVTGQYSEELRLYQAPLDQPGVITTTDLSAALRQGIPEHLHPPRHSVSNVVFANEYFHLQTPVGVLLLSCHTGHFASSTASSLPPPPFTITKRALSQHVNPGYTVLKRPRLLSVQQQMLVIDDHLLAEETDRLRLRFNAHPSRWPSASFTAHVHTLLPNPAIRFRHLRWPDGSEAFADSRGLLHLRSADKLLPEITVVLVQHQPVAAWVADGPAGVVCGAPYFTQGSAARYIPVAEFHEQYLLPFFKQLRY